ncbi:MAG: pyruvate, phosphate dikinase [Acidobacteria bacterium]|nr:pyruvate, phosphate dikinase [Acidobacteriota bacterium]
MTTPGDNSIDLMGLLFERAKELVCLYQVQDLTADTERTPDEVFRDLLEIIPPGWQHPDACWAKITVESTAYEPPGVTETPWVLRSPIVAAGKHIGAVEVFYDRQFPKADEGPFLKDERRLLDHIARRVGRYVTERRQRGMLRNFRVSMQQAPADDRREWRVIIEFLRRTDPHQLRRVSRRMINYLVWSGVAEAQDLLKHLGANQRDRDRSDENRPIERATVDALMRVTNAAFRMAANNLSDDEIVHVIEQWVKDDKVGFLVEAGENQGTSLREIADALETFQQMGFGDKELSRSVQLGLRVSLVRRFLTDDLEYINTAKNYMHVADFCDIVQRVVSPIGSRGKLGGKSSGLLLAYHIVRRSEEYADAIGAFKMPKTWYVTSDGLGAFIDHNHLQDIHNRKYLEIDQVRKEYPHIVQAFKNSDFPKEILKGLAVALDDIGDKPLVVRSSSLLEDRIGSAFSGKYKSLFLANRGTKRERMVALCDAIAEVYASIFSPDPIEYRAERGMLDLHEEMGLMIQEVVGTQVGRYYLPAFGGVAFNNNEFRWSPRIQREDGLVRMVPGLGTRAVDRLSDDYPVLLAPGQPGLRVNVTPEEVTRYSPTRIDLINLDANRFATVLIADLLKQYGSKYPMFKQVFSACDEDGLHPVGGFDWDGSTENLVACFEGLAGNTPFLAQMRSLLRVLREKVGGPVDIEFAHDGTDFYLLQCRPQSGSGDVAPMAIPRDIPPNRVLFTARRFVSNGRVPDLTHVVFVDPVAYGHVADLEALHDVGRAVGRLNKALPKRQFVLIGPGRWGSRGDVKLGVPVTYSDISNTALLMEVGERRGGSMPELSFSTHFFQDLVESDIRYLPLYPDDEGIVFNAAFLRDAPNQFAALVPEYANLASVIHVVDVPSVAGGQVLKVLMNADQDEAIGFFA